MSDQGSVGAARGCPPGCTNILPFTDGKRCGRPVAWEWVPPPRLASLTDRYGVKEARYCDACHGRIADVYPEWTKRRIASEQPPAGPSDSAPATPGPVLTELLRLYDWRFELAEREKDPRSRDVSGGKFRAETRRLLNQYGTEKKAAWEAARRVLASGEPRLAPSSPESPAVAADAGDRNHE